MELYTPQSIRPVQSKVSLATGSIACDDAFIEQKYCNVQNRNVFVDTN